MSSTENCDDPNGVTGAASIQLGGVVCGIGTLPVGDCSQSRPQQGQAVGAGPSEDRAGQQTEKAGRECYSLRAFMRLQPVI